MTGTHTQWDAACCEVNGFLMFVLLLSSLW